MFIKVCKNLQFHVKTDFWPNKFLLESSQLFLSKGKNWLLMGSSYVSRPRVRRTFGIRMVNSQKLSFHAHFRNTVKAISRSFQFHFNSRTLENVQIPSPKPFIFMHADWQNQITFGAEITTSESANFTCSSKPLKKTSSIVNASVTI